YKLTINRIEKQLIKRGYCTAGYTQRSRHPKCNAERSKIVLFPTIFRNKTAENNTLMIISLRFPEKSTKYLRVNGKSLITRLYNFHMLIRGVKCVDLSNRRSVGR
ncbi:MAG: hypothetical protein ACUVXA_06055, partial [Candidatus Jordarchaeum sp.]|uniref:hypothetical protein n=1 Tax=Candidatus Jordarchaeum sp. TaxID=2823881 RepID=UPI00404989A6